MYLLKSTFCCFCFSNYSKSSTLNPLSTLLFFFARSKKIEAMQKAKLQTKIEREKKINRPEDLRPIKM